MVLLNLLAPWAVLGVLVRFLVSPRRGLLRELPDELGERLGGLPAEGRAALAGRPVLWVHAASAGEVASVEELLRRLSERPDAPAVLVTTTTRSGRDAARRLGQVDAAALAPVDCWPAVRRFLRHARPYALILVETELWPNMIELSARAGLKLGLVNGRISQRSYPRYRLVAGLLRPFFGRLLRVAVQTEADAQRFCALGIHRERMLVAGNMKHDRLKAGDRDGRGRQELARLGWEGCPLLVAGSTHPGEEDAVLAAFLTARLKFPRLKLALAPRHVERADGVAEVMRRRGLPFARLGRETPADGCDALLVDAMGWLPGLYACATVAFVGGSLVPVGGHNLLEPAWAGVPVVFGPHTAHTREAAAALQACGGGFMVGGAAGLGETILRLLGEPELAARSGAQARELARSLQGATARTLEHLAPVLAPPLPGKENARPPGTTLP